MKSGRVINLRGLPSLIAAVAAIMAIAGSVSLINASPAGAADRAAGLAAWDRIYAVASHPRCVNCHAVEPMWSGRSYGKTRPHGMNIAAGASRMGAENVRCKTCHVTSHGPNPTPHAPPHVWIDWQLAPVAFTWFNQDSATICAQLRDPQRNGGRDGAGLVKHVESETKVAAFIAWSFAPGGGREPAPGSLQEHLADMIAWTAAGMPCPEG